MTAAVDDFVRLVELFAGTGRYRDDELRPVREAAARAVSRAARERRPRPAAHAARGGSARPRLRRCTLAARRAAGGRGRARRTARPRPGSPSSAATPRAGPIRVAAVFPEPTPYRAPLLDRVAALEEVDLTVIYAAETVAGRTWRVEPRHRAVFLRGVGVPGAERVLHHDYPLTPGIVGALERARPDVVVVSGWSTFAAQAALAWCRLRRVPYVLVVESHDEGPRAGWRRP